jgi:hypothetical protein
MVLSGSVQFGSVRSSKVKDFEMKAQMKRNLTGSDADTGIPLSGESAVGAAGVLLASVALLAVFVWISVRIL